MGILSCSVMDALSWWFNDGDDDDDEVDIVPFLLQVLRGHMQSIISVCFIESRGQLISLSKDKV